MDDRFVEIDNHKGYFISPEGKVWSNESNMFLTPWLKGNGYICIDIQREKYFLHRIIAHHFIDFIPDGYVVDHIDRDKSNNWPDNLRICTHSDNQKNKPKKGGKYTSKYIGVIFNKSRNKWQAHIHDNFKSLYLGQFKTENEAKLARDNFAKKKSEYYFLNN